MPGPKKAELDEAVRRGLSFLAKAQEKDGSFTSFSSPSIDRFRRVRSWQTVFVPALMLTSLAKLDQPDALTIRRGLAEFLLGQKSDNWSFNYWSKSAPEHTGQPYPDDLDDTFCALTALYSHDPSLIGADVMARIVKLLLATETAVGGPYRTWLVPKSSQPIWLDIDLAVNSNIAFFLSLTGSDLPRLDELMEQAIEKNSLSSPYYPNEYALIYYLSRSYRGKYKDQLLRKVRRMSKAASTDLDRALCIYARLRLGDARGIDSDIDKLLLAQRRDGSWPAATFYADPVSAGKLYYNGAPALTTAFVLEALRLYGGRGVTVMAAGKRGYDVEKIKRAALTLAREQCHGLDDNLHEATLSRLEKIAAGSNGNEIIGLPGYFYESLKRPPKNLPDDFLVKLGLANLYGWLAYTIYDDFIDDEGKPELISVANVSMRRSLDNFSGALPANRYFAEFTRQTFDTIDGSNAWELANCRFKISKGKLTVGRLPNYGKLKKLADRSLGHALPPMAVLAAANKNAYNKAAQKLLQAMQHYLIARQINDDAHDWLEDLRRGRVTPTVALILEGLNVRSGYHRLADLSSDARHYFWFVALPKICELTRRHVRLSRQALKSSGLVKPENVIDRLLDGVESSAEQALTQQSQAKDFLKHYRSPGKKAGQI